MAAARGARKRRHLQRLCRSRGCRSPLGTRHAAVDPAGGGMGRHRGGHPAARDTIEQGAGGRLRRAAVARRGPAAPRPGLRAFGLPAPLPRHQAPWRRDAPHVCRRPRALGRRPLVGGGRSHAGALGRGLRAGEPARHLASLRGSVSRPARAAPRQLLRHAARQPRALGAVRRFRAAHGAGDARSAQRNLLRAYLPCALPRHSAGGGQRSHGTRGQGLAENALRPAARARDPAAPG